MDNTFSDTNTANLANRAKASAGAMAGDAKTQVEGLAGQASEMAEQAYGQAKDKAREAATVVAKSVEEQPFMALLIGGLVCGVVGYLLARR
jgi:uncharacterized protein YjbJ (UPF0337 family)